MDFAISEPRPEDRRKCLPGIVSASLPRLIRNSSPSLPRQHGSGDTLVGQLSFSEAGRRYLPEVPGADQADAARRQPGDRGDAAPRETVAPTHVLDLFSPLPADPLRRPRCLPVALTRSSPPAFSPGPGPAPSPRRRCPDTASPGLWRCPDRWTPGG